MFDVGAIVGSIILDDRMTSGLQKAGRETQKFSGEAEGAEKSASKLSKAIEAIGAGAAAKSILDIGISLSKAGAAAEQTYISFRTFLGGSEAATKLLVGAMNEFANVTPFTNDQVYKAGRTLMAFGTSAKDVVPTLQLIGDVASGTGKDLSEMAVIFGQIKSTGKLMGQDLLQLINAGFNPLQEISRTSGKSVGVLKQEMEKGLITFKMVEDAFKSATKEGGLFAGMMEKQSQTFGGLMSTLEGTFGTMAAEIGQAMNTILKPALRAVIFAVESLTQWFRNLHPNVRLVLVAIVAGTAAFLAFKLSVIAVTSALSAMGIVITKTLLIALAPILLKIGLVVAAVLALAAAANHVANNWESFSSGILDPISRQLEKVADDAMTLGATMRDMGASVWESIGPPLVEGIVEAWSSLKETATEAGQSLMALYENAKSSVASSLADAWGRVKQSFGTLDPILKRIADAFARIRQQASELRVIERLGAAFEKIRSGFSGSGKEIDVLSTTIRGLLSPIQILLVTFLGLYRIFIQFVTALVDLGPKVTAVMATLKEAVSGNLIEWIKGGGLERTKKAFADLGKGITDPFVKAKNTLAETGSEIGKIIKGIRVNVNKEVKASAELPGGPPSTSGGGGKAEIDKELRRIQAEYRRAFQQFSSMGRSGGFSGLGELIAKGFMDDFAANVDELAKPAAKAALESLKDAIQVVQVVGIIADSAASTFQQVFAAQMEVAANNIQRTLGQTQLLGDLFLRGWEAQKNEELEILQGIEDAKIAAIRRTHLETLAMLDEEMAAKKAALQAELQAKLGAIEAERIMRGEQAADDAQTQKQRVTDVAIVNDDARRNQELAQKEYEEKLRALADETAAKRKEKEDQSTKDLADAEQAKADKIAEFNAKKEEEQKKHAKARALIEYMFALQAFAISQKQALAQAQFAYAASIVSAAQTVAAMTAATLGFGLPVALAVGATLVGMATVAYSAARAAIASAPPPLPSGELFAAEGGVLAGNTHQNGGTMVRAERGEAFLSRDLTNRLDGFLDGSQPTIVFGPGSIVVYGNMDQRLVQMLADEFGKRIRQRGR